MESNKNIRMSLHQKGSMDVAEFMGHVLSHRDFGYYTNKDPIGFKGDFITAPEISQLFGEMIGLKLADHWIKSGQPGACALVELGPGKGSLMNDLLRATAHVEGFHDAMQIFFVEVSNPLKEQQKLLVNQFSKVKFNWTQSINEIPSKPTYLVANEFFDALPVRQYVKNRHEWYEVAVTISPESGDYKFIELLVDAKMNDLLNTEYPKSKHRSYVETSSESIEVIQKVSSRIYENQGIAIIIDYGYSENNLIRINFNPTIQSVKNHKYNPVLSDVGNADITAHVDFFALSNAAEARQVSVDKLITQREFLLSMGIELRAKALKKKATDEQKVEIDRALERLISDEQMGKLFKVMVIRAN